MLAQFFRDKKTSQVITSPNACRVACRVFETSLQRGSAQPSVSLRPQILCARKVLVFAYYGKYQGAQEAAVRQPLGPLAIVMRLVRLRASAGSCGRVDVCMCMRVRVFVCSSYARLSSQASFLLAHLQGHAQILPAGRTCMLATSFPPGAPSKHLPNSVGLSAQDKESEAFEKIYGCHHGVPFTAVNGPDEGPATPTPPD
jgi:hypothetical protein